MKKVFFLVVLIFSVNATEIIDKNNLLTKLDQEIGDISYLNAFTGSHNYFQLSCFGPTNLISYCYKKYVRLKAPNYDYDNDLNEFVRLDKNIEIKRSEYRKFNKNIIRMFIENFAFKHIDSYYSKYKKYLLMTDYGCKTDQVIIDKVQVDQSNGADDRIIQMRLRLCMNYTDSPERNGWYSREIFVNITMGQGRSITERLKEFSASINGIGRFRLIQM